MKKEKIRSGGLKVFASKGFDDASMDDIAAEAGVAKGTLYYHYRSKEALYEDIVAAGIGHLIDVLETAKNQAETPINKLQGVLDENLRYLGEQKDFCMVLAACAAGAPQMREAMFGQLQRYFDYLESHLQHLRALGRLQPDLDIPSTAAAMFGLVLMVAVRRHTRGEPVFTPESRRTVLLMSRGALGFGPDTESDFCAPASTVGPDSQPSKAGKKK